MLVHLHKQTQTGPFMVLSIYLKTGMKALAEIMVLQKRSLILRKYLRSMFQALLYSKLLCKLSYALNFDAD